MMLRASIHDDDADRRAATLTALVDAVAVRSDTDDASDVTSHVGDEGPGERADRARGAVVDRFGTDWLVDACAVIANFEMMTRIADGTGARLRPQQLEAAEAIITEQGLGNFTSARR